MSSDPSPPAGSTSHPPLASDTVDAPHRRTAPSDFVLESGAVIQDFSVSYAVHGDMSDDRLPVAIALCAIGSVHHRLDFLIGPGKALDPDAMRIIAIDAIGNGLTTSPSNSRRQAGALFPRFTIRDMVRSQKLLLESLAIDKIEVVVGASMGGMQALQWGVEYPDAMRKIVAMTPMAKTAPWAAAVNQAARQSLLGRLGGCLSAQLGENSARNSREDTNKNVIGNTNGTTSDDPVPQATPADIWDGWIPIMQLLAMRTPQQVDRTFSGTGELQSWVAQRTEWWKKQGFDPIDWIYQSWAYDAHDVGTCPAFGGDTARALQSIRAETLIVIPPLDLYNPVEAGQAAAAHIPQCRLHTVDSDWGHLMASAADPEAALELNALIRRFIV